MYLCDEPFDCRTADPYPDLLDLVDEFRFGPAGRVHKCTLPFLRGRINAHSPDFGLTVQLVHVREDLCEIHPGRL